MSYDILCRLFKTLHLVILYPYRLSKSPSRPGEASPSPKLKISGRQNHGLQRLGHIVSPPEYLLLL